MSLPELSQERIDAVKAKHGEHCVALEALNDWLIFRKPTRGEYDRYIDQITADKSNVRKAAWELAQSTIVDPSPGAGALTTAMDLEPAILLSDIVPALNSLVGDDREKRRVKL